MSTAAGVLSGVAARVFRDGTAAFSTTTTPTLAEVLQWLNEYVDTVLNICAQEKSELGRKLGSISATLLGGATYSTFAADMVIPNDIGWILKTNSRDEITLVTEEKSLDFDPSDTGEPEHFYLDGSNNVVLLPAPDASYTIKIPYWYTQTTITDTSSTMPFSGLFDNLFIEAVTLRAQNRDEYDLSIELKLFDFIQDQARRRILMRRGTNVGIAVGGRR
jgi:hypothetical protein